MCSRVCVSTFQFNFSNGRHEPTSSICKSAHKYAEGIIPLIWFIWTHKHMHAPHGLTRHFDLVNIWEYIQPTNRAPGLTKTSVSLCFQDFILKETMSTFHCREKRTNALVRWTFISHVLDTIDHRLMLCPRVPQCHVFNLSRYIPHDRQSKIQEEMRYSDR